jgi:2-polyprenyl-6-hydroxyphenyl methylase/3-demethylubiquinone-9 3-methyltransferase
MSIVHDWFDWLGGYPFEVARPEELFLFYADRGYTLVNMTTTNKLGCNQLVLRKTGPGAP